MPNKPPPTINRPPPVASRLPPLDQTRAPPAAPAKRLLPLSVFAGVPDPLSDRKTGNPQADVEIQLGELHEALSDSAQGYRDRMKNESDRFKLATSGGFYFVACFETAEQCDAFLAGAGMAEPTVMIDGRVLADKLKIEIPASPLRKPPMRKPDARLAALVRRPGE